MIDVLSDVRDWTFILLVLTVDVRDDVLIDALTTITFVVGVEMPADVDVAIVLDLEFAVPLSCAEDVMAEVWGDTVIDVGIFIGARVDVMIDALARVFATAITSVAPDVDVDLLTDVRVNVVAAVMTALEITMSEEYLLFCSAAFTSWPTAVLDCDRVLQSWIPSYHV